MTTAQDRPGLPFTSTEEVYRRTWDGFYGEEGYPVESEIDPPRPWRAWDLFTAGIAVCSLIVLLHLVGVWLGWWD
jgi:hypothetical protein